MRRSRALLVLAVFLTWIGGAAFHTHTAGTVPCKVCQALQAYQADLPGHATAPELLPGVERIAAAAGSQAADVLLPVPKGRSPPLASSLQ